ncbi:MAG: TerC family protein [Acidobacteria bacterium]|nr:TerC family protein [Acidobacteriota bacterium]
MFSSIGTPLLWVGFTVFVLIMLALDLGVFHRSAHQIGHREAVIWSLFWIGLALTFNAGILHWFGRQHGLEFLTGYLIEKALSVDNIFVFLLIFSYFAVPAEYQHRVLFWGILGALVMRAIFILLGTVLLETFHWVIFLFGGFLIYAGAQMLRGKEVEVHPEHNPAVRLFQKYIPATSQYHGARLLIRQNGRTYATPLFLVLVVVEATDLVFAVDSIPAIFAVTRDPFIVYTSNIFAILGLRSLYFLLAASMRKFQYLKAGLGAVLLFVGVKMLLSEYYPIPIGISLAVIAIILGMSVLVSFLSNETTVPPGENPEQSAPPLPQQESSSSSKHS